MSVTKSITALGTGCLAQVELLGEKISFLTAIMSCSRILKAWRNGAQREGKKPWPRMKADRAPGGAWLRGHIEQSAYLGASVQYQIRSQGGALFSAVTPKTGRRFVAGDDVEIGWAADDALVVGGSAAAEENS